MEWKLKTGMKELFIHGQLVNRIGGYSVLWSRDVDMKSTRKLVLVMELKNFDLDHHGDLNHRANPNRLLAVGMLCSETFSERGNLNLLRTLITSPIQDESRDLCDLEMLLTRWLRSSNDIFQEERIKKRQENPGKIPLLKNETKVEERESYQEKKAYKSFKEEPPRSGSSEEDKGERSGPAWRVGSSKSLGNPLLSLSFFSTQVGIPATMAGSPHLNPARMARIKASTRLKSLDLDTLHNLNWTMLCCFEIAIDRLTLDIEIRVNHLRALAIRPCGTT